MTGIAGRYQRRQAARDRRLQVERFKTVEFGNPYPTFRASIDYPFQDEDLPTERRAYESIDPVTLGTTDTVMWTHWWEDYNRDIFEPFINPSGPDIGKLGAVELLVPGLYGIRATIDWNNEDFNLSGAFTTWLGTNFDDGGLRDVYMDLDGDILGSWTISDLRVVWPAFTSAENWVEIIAGHDHVAQTPLYIPGSSTGGYWGHPPHLTIVYFGGLEGPAEYFSDTT